MKILKNSLFLIFFIQVFPLFSAGKVLDKDILAASINGKPVTLLDILAETLPQERKLSLQFSGEALKRERARIRKEALNGIIDRKLIYEQFNSKGYKVPKRVIERMLDTLALRLAGGSRKLLESKARKAGLTISELREQARERAATSMLINEMCYRKAYVSPKEVYDFYNTHKSEFATPSRISLQVLYLKCDPLDHTVSQFADKLRKKIAGADEKKFSEFVALYSKGPNVDGGGKAGWIPENKLRPEFAPYLKGRNKGTVAGPIITDEGLYFIRICDREEEKVSKFTEVKESIRKKLSRKEEDKMYKRYISRLKRDAVIRIFNEGEPEDAENQL